MARDGTRRAESLAIPGFVDLQVNGFRGADFSSPNLTEEAFAGACRGLFAEGTAAFLPTLVSCPLDVYERNLTLIAAVMGREEFRGRLPGVHLEGPFLSGEPGAVGAHPPECIRAPDPALLDRLCGWAGGRVRLLTLAAEPPGACALARHAAERGITVSVGHSLYGPADLERMARAGATALTHLGNGLPNTLPRHDNPIWAGLADDRFTAMVIADGHHLPAAVLTTAFRAKGAHRVVIVSDASPAAGLPPGPYRVLGNDAVLEESGRLHNPEKECLVGSSQTLLEGVNRVASLDLLGEEELLHAGFHNPLRLIGADAAEIASGPGLVYQADRKAFRTVAPANPGKEAP